MPTDEFNKMAKPEFGILRLLGEGGFGKVYLIQDKKDPKQQYAMKLMDLSKMDQQELDLASQEIALLSSLDHKHVLAYVTCFTEDNQLCIITEFCPNGDLSDYIGKQGGAPLEELRLIEWFRQVASAVEYLHGKNIIHRDLKVQNIFLDGNMDCKLGDFGIARVLQSSTDMAQTQIGTPQYMSPELFMGLPYNAKTDIWSLAIVMYELATLEKPFTANVMHMLIFQVIHQKVPDLPKRYRPEFNRLVKRMMERDPADRPSAADIMKDPLFRDVEKPKPLPNLHKSADVRSDDYKSPDPKLNTFLQRAGEMSVGGRKLQDLQRRAKPPLPPKPKEIEEDNDPVMELVTRTLKNMGHDTVRPAGKNHLEQKVDLLEIYILRVLDNNRELFKKVSGELDNYDKNEDLEEKLIELLGHEKYGMCGMEFLHYKNFTYNLKHLKKFGKQVLF